MKHYLVITILLITLLLFQSCIALEGFSMVEGGALASEEMTLLRTSAMESGIAEMGGRLAIVDDGKFLEQLGKSVIDFATDGPHITVKSGTNQVTLSAKFVGEDRILVQTMNVRGKLVQLNRLISVDGEFFVSNSDNLSFEVGGKLHFIKKGKPVLVIGRSPGTYYIQVGEDLKLSIPSHDVTPMFKNHNDNTLPSMDNASRFEVITDIAHIYYYKDNVFTQAKGIFKKGYVINSFVRNTSEYIVLTIQDDKTGRYLEGFVSKTDLLPLKPF